jgi:hypothetical protein
MKAIQLSFAIAAITLLLTACSKNNDDQKINPPPPGPVLLWPGEDSLYTPEGNVQPSQVTSDNEAVVKAAIQGSRIKLSAGIIGTTNIRITDAANHTLPKEVRTMNLAYQWKSVAENEPYKTSVIVEATDGSFAETLHTELVNEAKIPFQLQFVSPYTDNVNESLFRLIGPNTNGMIEGSFSFVNLTLTLTTNGGKVTIYKVIPYANRRILALREDLTAYYQSLYPGKGITSVIITKHIRNYPPLG